MNMTTNTVELKKTCPCTVQILLCLVIKTTINNVLRIPKSSGCPIQLIAVAVCLACPPEFGIGSLKVHIPDFVPVSETATYPSNCHYLLTLL
jgi:hypothetical protein